MLGRILVAKADTNIYIKEGGGGRQKEKQFKIVKVLAKLPFPKSHVL